MPESRNTQQNPSPGVSEADVDAAATLLPEILRRLIVATIPASCRAEGWTIPQIRVLMSLSQHDTPMTVGEIAAANDVSMPTASESVERLVELEQVVRAPDPTDRRRMLVSLTAAARTRTGEIQRARRQLIKDAMERLSEVNRPVLTRSLEALAAAMQAAAPVGPIAEPSTKCSPDSKPGPRR